MISTKDFKKIVKANLAAKLVEMGFNGKDLQFNRPKENGVTEGFIISMKR